MGLIFAWFSFFIFLLFLSSTTFHCSLQVIDFIKYPLPFFLIALNLFDLVSYFSPEMVGLSFEAMWGQGTTTEVIIVACCLLFWIFKRREKDSPFRSLYFFYIVYFEE
jgi:hypothetical protein